MSTVLTKPSLTVAKPGTLLQLWTTPVELVDGPSSVRSQAWVRPAILVVAFSWLTALAAQVTIPLPFTPVPITGQSFAVLLTGLLLGPRLGALSIGLYLLQGGLGLPFFKGGSGGLNYLFYTATAGYLWAFPVAAAVTGWLAERGWDRHVGTAMAAMALGSFVILTGGWAWLAIVSQSATRAFELGVLPFLLGDVIKIALAGCVLPLAWQIVGPRRPQSK